MERPEHARTSVLPTEHTSLESYFLVVSGTADAEVLATVARPTEIIGEEHTSGW